MPVVAVGMAMYAGATIATVGVAAMSTMAVISAVGAIAAGVGVVTGNKELTRIGGIVGLVGGVGALAQSQGWLGAEIAKGGAEGMAAAGSGAEGAAAAAQSAAPGVIDPSAAVAQNVSQAGAGAVMDAGAVASTGLSPAAGGAAFDAALKTSGAAVAPASGGALSMLGSVGDWMEKNKNVTAMLSNFVGGALDQEKDAKIKQAEALAAQSESRTRIEQNQMANGSAVPDLTGLKVDPNKNIYGKTKAPVYTGVKPVGLINK